MGRAIEFGDWGSFEICGEWGHVGIRRSRYRVPSLKNYIDGLLKDYQSKDHHTVPFGHLGVTGRMQW